LQGVKNLSFDRQSSMPKIIDIHGLFNYTSEPKRAQKHNIHMSLMEISGRSRDKEV
jgi:hypothetical protein